MPNTYEPIASYTLTSTSIDVGFSSIPGTYTDLVLMIKANNPAGGVDIYFKVNGNSSSIYNWVTLSSNNTTPGATQTASATRSRLAYYGYPESTVSYMSEANFFSYANTNVKKSVVIKSSSPTRNGRDLFISLIDTTSAITSINIEPSTTSYPFGVGSVFALYGIKAA